MNRRIAWVTGGGTGIGRALARALYGEGHWVVISGRRADVLEQTAREITGINGPGDIWAMPGDVSIPDYAAEVQRAVAGRWGNIDLLINNAGQNPYHAFRDTTPDEFEEFFRINCLSAIRCIHAVLPAMLARKTGTIVNVSSILGKWASPDSAAYCTSKYALTGLTDGLRQELAGTGVHVMGVYPGFIRTAMTTPFVSPGSLRWRFGRTPESMAAAILRGIKRGKREVHFPWYVSPVLLVHHLFPRLLESLRPIFKR